VAGWTDNVQVRAAGPDALVLDGRFAAFGPLHRVGPLLYEGAAGRRIAFAEDPGGRFLAIGLSSGTFRQTSALESPAWSLPVFGVATLVILSAVPQLRRRAVPALRNQARLILAGFGLVFLGLLAEWQWSVTLGVDRGAVLAPALWRLTLLGGAAIMVWSSLGFWWRPGREVQAGWGQRGHGALLSAAGVTVPLVLVLWRLWEDVKWPVNR
jgi:hypothetical protein